MASSSVPFLVEGWGLYRMTWEDAYRAPHAFRLKTSLALTRHRIRRAMQKGEVILFQYRDGYFFGFV